MSKKRKIGSKQFEKMKECEVEDILRKRTLGNETEYLVKWKGYSFGQCTWVLESHLNCPDILKEFNRSDTFNQLMKARSKIGVLPFSVLNTLDPQWEEERLIWKNRGVPIDSFDPVLADVIYTWFCPSGGVIYDPYPIDPVRGIVAGMLDRKYIGVDSDFLNVKECKKCLDFLKDFVIPIWAERGSIEATKALQRPVDFVFSVPPVVELFSQATSYENFFEEYSNILTDAVNKLGENRFFCILLDDLFDQSTGFYLNIIGNTISLLQLANCGLYTKGIIYCEREYNIDVDQFIGARRLTQCHQTLLCFFKGDITNIPKDFGNLERPFVLKGSPSLPEKKKKKNMKDMESRFRIRNALSNIY